MPEVLLRVRGLCFARGPLTLLSHLDLDVARGDRLGVIGENGAGKSTLLALLTGELAPDDGALTRAPGAVCLRSPQGVDAPDARVLALAGDDDRAALRVRARLAVGPGERGGDVARWSTLSPGERRRWQLAALLHAAPDVLLLDEPSDHLDGRGRALLVDALAAFRGALVVVSHDRALLGALCPRTLRLHRGRARLFDAPVDDALHQLRAEDEAAADERQRARDDVTRAARALAATRREAHAAERSRRRSVRMRNADDHDARTMGAQVLADRASAKLSRSAALAQRGHDDAVARARALPEPDKRVGRDLHVAFAPLARPRLCVLETGSVVVAGRALAGPATLVVERHGRVRVAGDNGAGKSTLLAALVQRAGDVPGLVVLPQQLAPAEERAALDDVRGLPGDARGRALQLLAALGVDPARVLSSSHPSAGEARKLLLARALAAGAPALLLDEPTNHLDLPAVQHLEEALRGYPGALVVVTHDEAFARALGLDKVWRIVDGTVAVEDAAHSV